MVLDTVLFATVASAPTNLMAVQEGPTSIQVSWDRPTPLGDTTGYRIYYSDGSSGSVDINWLWSFPDNYLLTNLTNERTYSIYMVGKSQHLPSSKVELTDDVALGEWTCLDAVHTHN